LRPWQIQSATIWSSPVEKGMPPFGI